MSQAQPTTSPNAPSSWIFFAGLLLGGGLLLFIAFESFPSKRAHSPHVVELTEDNWQKEVIESKVPVLVDFTAAWCPPCQRFAPTVEELAASYAGKVKVGKVDLDANKGLATKYGVDAIPRVMIFHGGANPAVDFNDGKGAPTRETLVRALDAALAKGRS